MPPYSQPFSGHHPADNPPAHTESMSENTSTQALHADSNSQAARKETAGESQVVERDPNAAAEARGEETHAEGRNGGMGMVVLAATPIGNMGDASMRLRHLLATADIVAAEDTRRLYDLANRLGIRVRGKVTPYHDHNENQRADGLLDQVANGAIVLVVSDAGMPTINDPGHAIVERAIARHLPITCAPGPSAVLDALALSGLPTDRFCYEGFVPRKPSARRARLRLLLTEPRTTVFYESPQRIGETMRSFAKILPADRPMVLARELTKNFEQVRRSTVSGLLHSVENDPPRGEIVLIVGGASRTEMEHAAQSEGTPSLEDLAALARRKQESEGIKLKEAICQVVAAHPLPDGTLVSRKAVYKAALRH